MHESCREGLSQASARLLLSCTVNHSGFVGQLGHSDKAWLIDTGLTCLQRGVGPLLRTLLADGCPCLAP